MPILNRDRLLNAIVYFATRTKYCGKIKLFKLLYLLDFEHFRQTGKSVTGADYTAWKFGPVPNPLMEEWESPFPFDGLVEIVPEQVIDFVRQTVKPRAEFNADGFTQRQLKIMDELAEKYGSTTSPTMIDVTHAQNGAWEKVWKGGAGQYQPIPYTVGVADDSPLKEAVLDGYKKDLDRIRARELTHERA